MIEAFHVFIMSVMLFPAQLDPLPTNYDDLENKALRQLFPGPRGWFTTQVMKSLRHVGFPKELPDDLQSAAVAARARVALHENAPEGGLRVRTRLSNLRRLISDSDNILRRARYADWVNGRVIFSLDVGYSRLPRYGRPGVH
ncbi:unnamed protein product [Prorocentrum cordatum]|uniref:Uncharacterized protein n=1 Tax=Prorocentrum cordatum TaxID=2364126 RepID=A0ABN9SGS9_9DINO|nr:unnamed protein product [Polarella glacialis]